MDTMGTVLALFHVTMVTGVDCFCVSLHNCPTCVNCI